MKYNKIVFNKVIKYITNNEKNIIDMSTKDAICKLNGKFNKEGTVENLNAVKIAYTQWRKFYLEEQIPNKPKDAVVSFRTTKEEKKEINILLRGRNLRDLVLEVLRNE